MLDIWEVKVQLPAKVMDCARQDIIAQKGVAQSLVIHQQVYQPQVETVNICVVNILLPH